MQEHDCCIMQATQGGVDQQLGVGGKQNADCSPSKAMAPNHRVFF